MSSREQMKARTAVTALYVEFGRQCFCWRAATEFELALAEAAVARTYTTGAGRCPRGAQLAACSPMRSFNGRGDAWSGLARSGPRRATPSVVVSGAFMATIVNLWPAPRILEILSPRPTGEPGKRPTPGVCRRAFVAMSRSCSDCCHPSTNSAPQRLASSPWGNVSAAGVPRAAGPARGPALSVI